MVLAWDVQMVWTFELLHNPVYKWAALLGVLLAGFVVGKVLSFVLEREAHVLEVGDKRPLIRTMLASLSRPTQMAFFGLALHVGQLFLVLDIDIAEDGTVTAAPDGPIRIFWQRTAQALIALAVAWAVFRMVDILEVVLSRAARKTDTALDEQLVPLIRKTFRVFVVILAGLFIAQNIFEWNVSSIIAGLGIGGLAFAFAAKDSLANLFGSAVIFADRPFKLGDWIVVQGQHGTVEEVGFRSTRIRTFFDHQLVIPNSVIANETIENVARRGFIRRNLNISVTYDTPPERMQRAVEILREMLDARAEQFHRDRPYRVVFSDFNADNLNILVVYYFIPADHWLAMAFHHEFNLELLRRFNEEGIEFAFPTQTLYLRQGRGGADAGRRIGRDDQADGGRAYT